MKKILIISGSPQKDGNTRRLAAWFTEGVPSEKGQVELVDAASLRHKVAGCASCRACQKAERYGCVIDDEVSGVLARIARADVIVMATPLYFFGPSAQLKIVFDRMFSLYKWDNAAKTMKTVLKGKTLVLLGSAFEDVGLDALEKPFALTAEYSGMAFKSLVVANAGVSGDLARKPGIREQAAALGKMAADTISLEGSSGGE